MIGKHHTVTSTKSKTLTGFESEQCLTIHILYIFLYVFFLCEQFENMLEITLKAQICANLNFTSYLPTAMVIQ